MDIAIKIKALLNMHGMTSAQLRQVASISRATWSRIMAGHVPSERTLARIANALDVSPGYLRGGYQLPAWLSEEDIMFLAGRKNAPLLRMVREAAEKGLSPEDLKKLIKIIERIPG